MPRYGKLVSSRELRLPQMCSMQTDARWDVILVNREGSRHYGLRHDNLVLSKELIKVGLPPWKIWKSEVLSVSRSSSFWRRLSKSFTVIIRPLSTRLTKTNFHFSHRRRTTVSLETRNSLWIKNIQDANEETTLLPYSGQFLTINMTKLLAIKNRKNLYIWLFSISFWPG